MVTVGVVKIGECEDGGRGELEGNNAASGDAGSSRISMSFKVLVTLSTT